MAHEHHDCGHHHSHGAGHHHHRHVSGSIGRMTFALVLNLSFAVIELIGGFYTNSVAIMSDALHDFGDSIALAIAIVLEKLSYKNSNAEYSYGYRRFSVLGALVTGVILIVGSVFILSEAIPRIMNPEQPKANEMILLALLGVVVNGAAALRVSKGSSLNERMLMWHMIEDVMGWVIVFIGAIVMKFWFLPQIDAALAIILSLWVMYNVFKNLHQASRVFLMANPLSMNLVLEHLKKDDHVLDVHHTHLWSLDGEKHILTAHLVLRREIPVQQIQNLKMNLKESLKALNIIEATFEIETKEFPCKDPVHKDE